MKVFGVPVRETAREPFSGYHAGRSRVRPLELAHAPFSKLQGPIFRPRSTGWCNQGLKKGAVISRIRELIQGWEVDDRTSAKPFCFQSVSLGGEGVVGHHIFT